MNRSEHAVVSVVAGGAASVAVGCLYCTLYAHDYKQGFMAGLVTFISSLFGILVHPDLDQAEAHMDILEKWVAVALFSVGLVLATAQVCR